MEDYPSQYTTLARPLIVLLGLKDEATNTDLPKPLNNGAAINSYFPCISPRRREDALRYVQKYSDRPLSGASDADQIETTLNQALIYHFKASNRKYVFPSRKASPPPSQVSPIGSSGISSASPVLHSPLSPLSPGSPCHPNGVMTPLWFEKYQEASPAVFVSFFELTHDINNDTLHDNRLKNDISAVQSALESINVKSKLVAVLLGDEETADDPSLEGRLNNIRKGAKLEAKTTFFFLHYGSSPEQAGALFDSLFQACRGLCVEFFKNLHKHARRKKDRRSSSLPTTPSLEQAPQHLLHAGWNARYALKMGFFSEVRYEMDAAARSYDEALDFLMEPGGTFDQTSSWSPRFNEIRLLADCIALRRIRTLLADGHTTNAASSWMAYHDRVQDMVERVGKGTSSYGWPCWQARWARAMGQLVERAPSLASDSNARRNLESLEARRRIPYAIIKGQTTQPQDLLNPFMKYLHHAGYWLSLAAEYSKMRATYAQEIPDEDRNPPGQSPAASVARVHREYESYLCPEPHVEANDIDHAQIIVHDLMGAMNAYEQRGHTKVAAITQTNLAKTLQYMSRESASRACIALTGAQDTVGQHWTTLAEDVTAKLFSASNAAERHDIQVKTMSQIMHRGYRGLSNDTPDLSELLRTTNETCEKTGSKQSVQIDLNGPLSFVSLEACFQSQEVSAAERTKLQVTLRSSAVAESRPITFSKLHVTLENLGHLILHHEATRQTAADSRLVDVIIQETESQEVFTGATDLVLHPGQTRVFNLSLPMHEVGDVRLKKLALTVDMPWLEVEYTKEIDHVKEPFRWYSRRNGVGLIKQRQRWGAGQVNILPKQPKLKLQTPSLRSSYYTNEKTTVTVEMINEEADDIDVELEAWIVGVPSEEHALHFKEASTSPRAPSRDGATCIHVGHLSSRNMRKLELDLRFPSLLHGEVSLELEARYHALEDTQRRNSKITSTKINLVEPYQTSFTLEPFLHPDPWPSYFDAASSAIKTNWRLQLNLTSQADEDTMVEKIEMRISHVEQGATCNVDNPDTQQLLLATSQAAHPTFTLHVTKSELDDPRPASVEANVSVTWHRAGSPDNIETLIPTPRLNLPTSEPRALATRQPHGEDGSFPLTITLENPSMHYLSFEVNIDANDDFVLSGPTRRSLNLVPLSRHAVELNILPLVVPPNPVRPFVKVIDTYFNKLLRVHPGEGMSIDDSGSLVIWLDES